MKRKKFLRLCASATLSVCVSKGLLSSGVNFFKDLDKYGGWRGRTFNATGFFRVEKDDRWWLVTPEGNAFLSFGVNHFHSGWWREPYNRHQWMQLLGIKDMSAFNGALRKWFLDTCLTYGFNTVGVHSDLKVVNAPMPNMPYVKPITFVDISHWKNDISDDHFTDVFSRDFRRHCDQLVQEEAAPLKDDPFLLGYAMADCPLFTEEDCRARPDTVYGGRRASRVGWPRRLRNLGPSSAGKQAYVELVSKLYNGRIEAFNKTYGTRFDSFEVLEWAENWRKNTDLSNASETRDNTEFLKVCVAQYYKTAKAAIRSVDPNHLFLGDKLNGNTDAVDTILSVTSKYTDILFYQMYGRYELQNPALDRWSASVDIPIINGDSAYTHIREGMPQPYGPIANSESQNAEWTQEFFTSAFARSEFVGWHYCGLIDTPYKLVAKEADRQHSGLFNGYGVPYQKLREAFVFCSEKLYDVATG